MRQQFAKDLKDLQKELIKMGEFVEKALSDSMEALKKKDLVLAQQVIDNDKIIDEMQVNIEDRCLILIALQQPMAKDLRILSTALKITTDLERMGDHAKNIAKTTKKIGNEPLIKPLVDIPRMVEKVIKMLKDSLNAYVNLDIELAYAICEADDEVDNLCDQSLRELLTYMIADPSTIQQSTHLLNIARRLERCGDHTTNIAEWVVYLVKGERYKGN